MADAGLAAADVDGMLSYSLMDAAICPEVASDLGIRLDFYMDVWGGGSSTEALVGIAIGAIEAGMCRTVVIYRAMNGYSQLRMGGTGWGAAPVAGDELHWKTYGWTSPANASVWRICGKSLCLCGGYPGGLRLAGGNRYHQLDDRRVLLSERDEVCVSLPDAGAG